MGNCNNCTDCDCDAECTPNSGGDYITGYSVFDRRENQLNQEDVECEFAIGDKVYNPNTREYGIVDGYKKMLGSTFVLFTIIGINDMKDSNLFANDNKGRKYYVEPCFIVKDSE